MAKKKSSSLHVQDGVEQPQQVNEKILEQLIQKRKKEFDVNKLFEGILSHDRVSLSQAITLIESNLPEHQDLAQELIERCLPYAGNSIRIGITGPPGAGKSTFIEAFGTFLTSKGHSVAVLAIDPSSQNSKGSILGDKTRMEKLSINPKAFIRPSPSAGTLGGVSKKTKESIIICEAAGFDIIIVETVGVGQSEVAAHSMVDFFTLLHVPGTGDELQGIKRGIMELVHAILINKADGDNILNAEEAKTQLQNAIHFLPPPASGVPTYVGLVSALQEKGIEEFWNHIQFFVAKTKENGTFYQNRKWQEVIRFQQALIELFLEHMQKHPEMNHFQKELETQVFNLKISPYAAAQKLFNKFKM